MMGFNYPIKMNQIAKSNKTFLKEKEQEEEEKNSIKKINRERDGTGGCLKREKIRERLPFPGIAKQTDSGQA